MKTVNNWLITWTACLLRHSRLFIMIPILSGFLLSYPALYDFTLRPLNGSLLTLFDDCVLADGLRVVYQNPQFNFFQLENFKNSRVSEYSFAGSNVLKYESLVELDEWSQNIPNGSRIFSPLSFVPESVFKNRDADKQRQIEKCFLKIMNHDVPSRLITLFFDKFQKQNHVVNSATSLKVFILFENDPIDLPKWNGKSMHFISKKLMPQSVPGRDFLAFYKSVSGKNPILNWSVGILGSAQLILIMITLLRVYLSICNSHKIRSNIGLVIGWLNSVLISFFVSLSVFSMFNTSSGWPDMSDPITLIMFGYFFLTVLILSSRNLFRTVNDLAGDSTFGETESLHKRLLKFYLGFNSSSENSEGVFHISSFIRRTLRLDSYCHMTPIPNTTIILMINVSGLSVTMGICASFFRLFLDNPAWNSFCVSFKNYLKLTIFTLIVDHVLQLTYMVAIIVIDLNRIDLTDVLAKAVTDDNLDFSNLHEVNPFSAKLLASKGDARSTWNHKLGTYLLKVSPHTPKSLWSKVLPLLCICISAAISIQDHLAEKYSSVTILGHDNTGTIISNGNDTLYFIELVAVIILIVAISEITFTLTFSKRQKENVDSVVLSDRSEMSLAELSNIDTTRKFEDLTLADPRTSEMLRLFANPKAPILVTTDLDHRVSLWSPLSKNNAHEAQNISALFETSSESGTKCEFWPINHAEISNEGDYVVLINNRNCRIKCYSRISQSYIWEISLTSELSEQKNKMKPVLCFFRKKAVAGFFARELLVRRKKLSGRGKRDSNSSLASMHGNYPPPLANLNLRDMPSNSSDSTKEYDASFNRDEFVLILETGQMITISCDSVKIKVYNLFNEVFSSDFSSSRLKIISSKFLTTARVNDRVICTVSDGQIVVGSAINNIWRFSKLKINDSLANSRVVFAPPAMTRGTWVPLNQNINPRKLNEEKLFSHKGTNYQHGSRSSSMNEYTIVTIDFVGMFVRVNGLQAELIDIQTGTVLRLFHIGSFKPGSFRVSHSEPTHCKFCGCVSFETMSLIYEDFYDKKLIVHTFRLENRKSRNNICLRVERDPLEIRCLGFDAVLETQYWFDDIELWELTDMNVIMGIKKVIQGDESTKPKQYSSGSEVPWESIGLSSLRNRHNSSQADKSKKKERSSVDKWQGFLVTVSDGKLLDYKISMEESDGQKSYCMRPTLIIKFGFKAVAIAFGRIIKIIYLGNDNLIENDLYYSGSASTIKPLLDIGGQGSKTSSELLFINKRRRMIERKFAKLNN